MSIMKAVVLDAPGPPEALQIREVPIPIPRLGEVLIKVEAFGLNRSELHTRLGLAVGVTFPRVLGIEATGTVAACPGGEFGVGQQVATMMGGMGRTFDGGYAEYTCVSARQVVPFTSNLDWATLGAVPEMLQTAYGSLTIGLDAQPGQSILIRGGTSSVAMATAVLARRLDMIVLSTTRNPGKIEALRRIGADHVLIDDGPIADRVRDILPGGVDTAIELIGTPTLPDTLAATRLHGVVCFTGMLSNVWTVSDFYPIDYIPPGCGSPPIPVRRPICRDDPAGVLRRRCGGRGGHSCTPRLPPRRDPAGSRRDGGRLRQRQDRRSHRAQQAADR